MPTSTSPDTWPTAPQRDDPSYPFGPDCAPRSMPARPAPRLFSRLVPGGPSGGAAGGRVTRAARPAGRRGIARRLPAAVALCLVWLPFLAAPASGPARAQATGEALTDPARSEAFASENAVLDTGIPLAIGAREARQSLRGAFGWPTFQEGLVDGVYFRFDPDGYARFAPTPRLDRDVFEVICRPRTTACVGRKGPMTLQLTSRGQLQIQLEGTRQGDRYFVSEGVTEIELPETILAPLEPQMELLLAAGGDLIVRRTGAEADRVSLTGLYAVGAYLRWVAAGQDHTVLPRGWPVPAAGGDGAVTNATNWTSPMPQPQVQTQPQVQPQVQSRPWPGTDTDPRGGGIAKDPILDGGQSTRTDVAEVRGELRILRELLLNRAAGGGDRDGGGGAVADPAVAVRLAELQKAAAQISADIARLQGQGATSPPQPVPPAGGGGLAEIAASLGLASGQGRQIPPGGLQSQPQPQPQPQPLAQPLPGAGQNRTPEARRTAERLGYLITEIGLDPKTAVTLVEMASAQGAGGQDGRGQGEGGLAAQTDEALVNSIIEELEPTRPARQGADYRIIAEFLRNTLKE